MVVCAVENLIQLLYALCPCLLDTGSMDIQVLPKGLAFITSVSSGDCLFLVINHTMLLLISMTPTITAFIVNTIFGNVDNDDEDTSKNVEGVVARLNETI